MCDLFKSLKINKLINVIKNTLGMSLVKLIPLKERMDQNPDLRKRVAMMGAEAYRRTKLQDLYQKEARREIYERARHRPIYVITC